MQMTWLQAANAAVREEMARDERVFVMGEDVQAATYGLSDRLVADFGPERVRNTPICEETMVGAGVGAAMCGLRPFVDLNNRDVLVHGVRPDREPGGEEPVPVRGQATLPMVIYLNEFHRSYAAAQHTDRPHGLFMAMPGLTVIAPGTPADAKGMIKSAIRSDDRCWCSPT
jgi:pyruvate dehydrogenase E1 component beta subunit